MIFPLGLREYASVQITFWQFYHYAKKWRFYVSSLTLNMGFGVGEFKV